MRNIHEIRLANLRDILLEHCNGKQKVLSAKIGKNQNTISRWLGSNENRANISDDSARLLEEKFGLETGFMDNIHTNDFSSADKAKLREYFSDYAAIAEASPKNVDPLMIFDAAFARWESEKPDSKKDAMDIFFNLHTSKK